MERQDELALAWPRSKDCITAVGFSQERIKLRQINALRIALQHFIVLTTHSVEKSAIPKVVKET